jgi:chaperonin GroEL
MEIAGGYLSPHFITDAAREEAKLDRPYFLIVRGRLSAMGPILGVLEAVAKSGRSLLVVAEEVGGEALATLIVNKIRGSLRCCAVRAGTDQAGSDAMNDLARLTGATVVSETGIGALELGDLGGAESAVVSADRTTILGGALLN